MSISVSSLNQFVDQSSTDFIIAFLAKGLGQLPAGFIDVRTGIKGGSIQNVPLFTNTVNYQAGGCSLTASGTTAFAARALGTTLFEAKDTWCHADLSAKFPVLLSAGANGDIKPEAAGKILDDITSQVARDVAKAAWQGGYSTSVNSLYAVQGWLYKLIKTTYSASTFGTTSAFTAYNSSNAVVIIDEMVANIPDEISSMDLTLLMQPKDFNVLKVAYRNAYGQGSLSDLPNDPNGFTMITYNNITARKHDGLTGSNAMVLAPNGQFLFGTDLESDFTDPVFGNDGLTNLDYYRIPFSFGCEIAFPAQIGVYKR